MSNNYTTNGLSENNTDRLTGCLNAVAFELDFKYILAEADKKFEDVTLVMVDIDHFKLVNDNYGHKTGDDMIRELANVLTEIVTDHKTYRCGGEEFALVFPNVEKERVFLIMEETRKKITENSVFQHTSTTVSAGIATYPEDGTRDVDIIRKANGALYRAKASGRNRISLAKEEKLVPKTVHFTVEQLKQLEKLSGETGISEAALLREALDELIKKYDKAKFLAEKSSK
jgi:diguanylate cyclase (GGDEF)-like protein